MEKITGTVKMAKVNGMSQIVFRRRSDFPGTGRQYVQYVATDENKIYRYDKTAEKYICIGTNPDKLQNQIDNIVIASTSGGSSAIEVAQARVDSDGTIHETLKKRLDSMESDTESVSDEVAQARVDSNGTTHEDLKARLDGIDSSINDVESEINAESEKINNSLSNTNSLLFGEVNLLTALAGENPMVFKSAIYQDGSIAEDNRRLMVRYTINGVRRYKLTNKNYLFRIIGYKDKVDNIYENYNKDNILGKGEYTNEYINTWDNCIIIFKRVDEGNITNEDIANLYDSFSWAKPIVNDVSEEIEKAKMTDLSGYAVNVTRDGTNLMYVSKSETPNIRITAIELKKDVFINVKCKNINRCRVGVKNSKMSAAIDNLINLSDRTYVDDMIINNDALTAYEFAYYNTAENATVFLYLTHGEEEVNPEIIIDYDIKKYIDDNASTSKSPTYKAVDEYIIKDFEPFEQDYSASKGNGVTSGVDKNQAYQSTQPDTFLHTFYDPYIGVSDDGNYSVTKTVRGKDESGTWDIFEYDFCPKHYTKTILLTGGEHAYETPASFGLALWVKNLMENTGDADLQWIKNNIRIKMIPMSNPWGFSQYPKSYGNCNGVNPNRNFDNQIHVWDKFPVYSPNPSDENYNQWNYKGEYPFSESETRIWRDWVIENKDDAEFWIDCHTGVYCTRADNWVQYQSTNPLISKIKRAINALSRRIERVYDKTPTVLEEVDKDTALKISYGTDVVGIPTLVIEQADLGVPWWSEYYNSAAYITEYATTVHAYVSSLLMPD